MNDVFFLGGVAATLATPLITVGYMMRCAGKITVDMMRCAGKAVASIAMVAGHRYHQLDAVYSVALICRRETRSASSFSRGHHCEAATEDHSARSHVVNAAGRCQGYPLFGFLAKLMTLTVPFGGIACRVNLG
eukprot:CAMPEP_0175824800 /NCGR_PEP_ID=MMETSP0107_2-20121207/10913_1 /TAXON_ID=195067 ORGANISM="Goniomonas pacifica, Strain CCMP1869" /NCGR_SAMPLE_ID=MMETSP0107_2 /ASSEMBLY_ACC=CAM_ASM_000203 /LENGTH=132 /DNA_ID=CAMNT_0017137373 /DNA_START=118 /DNA_END=514 /DNA_ORIENTATION=-